MVEWQGSLRMTTSLKVPKEALMRPRTTNGNITNSENTKAITRGTTSAQYDGPVRVSSGSSRSTAMLLRNSASTKPPMACQRILHPIVTDSQYVSLFIMICGIGRVEHAVWFLSLRLGRPRRRCRLSGTGRWRRRMGHRSRRWRSRLWIGKRGARSRTWGLNGQDQVTPLDCQGETQCSSQDIP